MQIPELDLEKFSILDNINHGFIKDLVNQSEYRLEALDILFLRCIDGKKSVNAIHDELVELLDYEIPHELIWKAFDNLSDIGILKQRLSPPAGGQATSRRTFMRKFGATAAASTVAMAPAAAFGQSEAVQKEAAAKSSAEQSQKQAEQSEKNPSLEQEAKVSAEESQKEEAIKNPAQEQNDKIASEQTEKNQAEQASKSQEQNQKVQSQEAEAKSQAEQQQKNPALEQNAKSTGEEASKSQAEENGKIGAEQLAKSQAEQTQKISESQAKNSSNEFSNKESLIKQQGGGGPVSVSEPQLITLLGLGLSSLALLHRRKNKVSKSSHSKVSDDDQSDS